MRKRKLEDGYDVFNGRRYISFVGLVPISCPDYLRQYHDKGNRIPSQQPRIGLMGSVSTSDNPIASDEDDEGGDDGLESDDDDLLGGLGLANLALTDKFEELQQDVHRTAAELEQEKNRWNQLKQSELMRLEQDEAVKRKQKEIERQKMMETLDHQMEEFRLRNAQEAEYKTITASVERSLVPGLSQELMKEFINEFVFDIVSREKNLIPFSDEDAKEAEELLYGKNRGKLVEAFNIVISSAELKCLRDGTWLNDEVINFYLELLNARCERTNKTKSQYVIPASRVKCHFFNTFFHTKLGDGGKGYKYQNVKRWSQKAKINVFQIDKVIFPVHVGLSHWCLGVINMREKRFEYYDSLHGANPACLQNMKQYVRDEAKTYNNQPNYDFSGWTEYVAKDCPSQTNGSDCGVFTCKFADYVSEDRKLDFSQSQMKYFRRRMALEITRQYVM